MTEDEAKRLDELAAGFSDRLTELTRGVLGEDVPRFHAVNLGTKVQVSPIVSDGVMQRIPVRIDGEVRLNLMVRYFCCWDGIGEFMATDQAHVHVFYDGVPDPLFRYEYERKTKEPPGAHIQVHAHRDELAFLLRWAEKGRPKQGLKRKRLPRLSELHFPVGGHRMRPALEDVLLLLHREFAIDVEPGWQGVLQKSLRDWRRTQLKTAVRDSPDVAAEVLRSLGYEVKDPAVPHSRKPDEDVKLYWA